MRLILIFSIILGCAVVNGFRTSRQTAHRPEHRPPSRPDCLKNEKPEDLQNSIKTCVGRIIKSEEFRSSLDLGVCDFVKKAVNLGMSCFAAEMAKNTGCSPEVLDEFMGINSDTNMGIKYVEFMFCGGPNPFQPNGAPVPQS